LRPAHPSTPGCERVQQCTSSCPRNPDWRSREAGARGLRYGSAVMTDPAPRSDGNGHGPPRGEPPGALSGYVCPTCGVAPWERRDGADPAFECRIGHPFEALELWVAHCTDRNSALLAAARALAENAALARKLAAWSRERGNPATAARIVEEAELEERYHEQVERMLEGLESIGPEPA
jgi:hypothetical protein